MSETLRVASRKGLLTYLRVNGGWERSGPPAFLGEPVSAVLTDARDGTAYAALRLGHFGVKLHRSDDGGGSWHEIACPAYPVSDDPDASALEMIWTLAPGGSDQPGRLWAGTLPGGLFRSDDRGDSWTLVTGLWDRPERAKWFGGGYDHPGIHSVLVDPRDSRRITLGVSCGGVWKSDDDSETWRQAGHGLRSDYLPPDQARDPTSQDPHLLSACRSSADRVWCQHHNGIFVSSDAAETFEELEGVRPSHFGFAVAAHPDRPDTAYFAPAVKDECRVPVDARFVVTKTEDGGRTMTTLSRGLPAAASYDLVYRHALVIDGSGNALAMGTTTGNLWTSDDAGETWTQLSATLPPVAQVEFA